MDAELAVLLRLTGFIGDQPAIGYEMRGLTAGVADTSAFDVPPGAHSRGALDGLGLTPATAAKTAAGLGVAGAAALVGWLQKRPAAQAPRLPDPGSRIRDPGPAFLTPGPAFVIPVPRWAAP